MVLVYPKEIRQLKQQFKPFVQNCELVSWAPKSARDAFDEYFKWLKEMTKDQQ